MREGRRGDLLRVMRRLSGVALVIANAACVDNTVTRYAGTAMNTASPERAAPITFTLWAHSDTSFNGLAELGAPLGTTGAVYVWHAEAELRLVSVDGEGDEVILWKSRSSDRQLGGTFEVTAGPREGQTGTWRATLTTGSAASPETLRAPQPFPIPPWTAMWPIPLLVLIAIGMTRWVRATPSPDASRERLPIRGWLVAFAITQLILLLASPFTLSKLMADYQEGIRVAFVVPVVPSLVVIESIIPPLAVACTASGLFLLVRRSPFAPRFWRAWLAVMTAFAFLDLVGAAYYQAVLGRLLGAEHRADTAANTEAALTGLGRQLFVTAAWCAYWIRSRRVRLTFGEALAPGSEPGTALPARTITRTVAQVALGVGLLFALAVLQFWQRRARPYPVPAGTDVRDLVAGRWSWTTETPTCGSATHEIAFTDSGKVMTITLPRSISDTGAGPTITTYDIRHAKGGVVRGAIRGEDRLQDDGTPVVWDLVLTGSDEYRWRRTDWRGWWGFTPAIIRCDDAEVSDSTGTGAS